MNTKSEQQPADTDSRLWQCPECGHVMTEDESKHYRSCPAGVHFVHHERYPSQPMPTSGKQEQEWTYERLLQYANPDYSDLNHLASAINASITSERQVLRQQIVERNYMIEQLREQLAEKTDLILKTRMNFQ